jgi:RNA polymerase primary sigma factor
MQISEVVDGFVSDDEADDYVAEEDFDEFDEEDDDDGQGGSKALTKKLEELKNAGAGEVRRLRGHFDKMRKAYEKDGYKSAGLQQGAARHQRRDDDHPLHGQDHRAPVRHPAQPGRRRAPLRTRDPQDRGRQVRHAAGPLHQDFPPNVLNLQVGREGNRSRQALQRRAGPQPAAGAGTAAEADRPAVKAVVPLEDLKQINKKMNEGEKPPAATPRRK